ncbi:MAG: ribose 5-phosphate isomerase B [Deltaproteobacteria bacterium]|nr:ribose 5-phosphate isomerase B [Deltaproteobacteria bacterium]
MRIACASDHAGRALRLELASYLRSLGHEVDDLGTNEASSSDYADWAHEVAERVVSRASDRGLLVCGSGIGMSIAANRHTGVRALVAMVEHQARMARMHNDANVLCLGERFLGVDLAKQILSTFLSTEFEGGRHAGRVKKIELAEP